MFYLFIYCWEHLLSPVLANFDYTRWCSQLVITSDFQTYSLMVESLYPFATSMCSSWSLSLVQLCATLWTVAHQAPLSMGFFRQEYWSGLPFTLPGDLPDSGIKLASLVSPALAGRFFTTEQSGKPT